MILLELKKEQGTFQALCPVCGTVSNWKLTGQEQDGEILLEEPEWCPVCEWEFSRVSPVRWTPERDAAAFLKLMELLGAPLEVPRTVDVRTMSGSHLDKVLFPTARVYQSAVRRMKKKGYPIEQSPWNGCRATSGGPEFQQAFLEETAGLAQAVVHLETNLGELFSENPLRISFSRTAELADCLRQYLSVKPFPQSWLNPAERERIQGILQELTGPEPELQTAGKDWKEPVRPEEPARWLEQLRQRKAEWKYSTLRGAQSVQSREELGEYRTLIQKLLRQIETIRGGQKKLTELFQCECPETFSAIVRLTDMSGKLLCTEIPNRGWFNSQTRVQARSLLEEVRRRREEISCREAILSEEWSPEALDCRAEEWKQLVEQSAERFRMRNPNRQAAMQKIRRWNKNGETMQEEELLSAFGSLCEFREAKEWFSEHSGRMESLLYPGFQGMETPLEPLERGLEAAEQVSGFYPMGMVPERLAEEISAHGETLRSMLGEVLTELHPALNTTRLFEKLFGKSWNKATPLTEWETVLRAAAQNLEELDSLLEEIEGRCRKRLSWQALENSLEELCAQQVKIEQRKKLEQQAEELLGAGTHSRSWQEWLEQLRQTEEFLRENPPSQLRDTALEKLFYEERNSLFQQYVALVAEMEALRPQIAVLCELFEEDFSRMPLSKVAERVWSCRERLPELRDWLAYRDALRACREKAEEAGKKE